MPPKRIAKQKKITGIDSPLEQTSKTTNKMVTQKLQKGGKQTTVEHDQDELGIGGDVWSPVRRSPSYVSNKNVNPVKSSQKQTLKVEVEDLLTVKKGLIKGSSKKSHTEVHRNNILGSLKTSTIARFESGSESMDSDEEPKLSKTRGGKKRTFSSEDEVSPNVHTKISTNPKTPETPTLDVSTSSSPNNSPITRKYNDGAKASPQGKRINGSGANMSDSDSHKLEELNKATKQLVELTKKYEDLKKKGIQEAEKTFSEYKNSAEKRFKASDNAIQRLKEELADIKERRSAKKQLENRKLLEEQSEELESLKNQLVELQTEREELGKQTATQASPNLDSSLQLCQELSRLNIVRIEKTEQEIIFECELTGGKGTLRYLLRQDLDDPETYHYEPLLDEEEDSDLMEQMPSYFNETISFKKPYASLFFWRALDSLKKDTKKH